MADKIIRCNCTSINPNAPEGIKCHLPLGHEGRHEATILTLDSVILHPTEDMVGVKPVTFSSKKES